MKRILFLVVLCLAASAALPIPGLAFGPGESGLRLVYAERAGDVSTSKEYLVEKTASGYRIQLFNQGVKRTIVCDENLDTVLEEYAAPDSGDELTFRRQEGGLRLTGTLDGKSMDQEFPMDGVWYGSVLLLSDFVLSGREKTEFYVTKPEEEQVVKLVAIREGTEEVKAGDKSFQAVKVKYTVPGIRGMFWKSYYWYRASDGLLVKTEETRGMPGTPTVRAELMTESELPAQPSLAALR
ncbi:hypothetical protein [Desulfocurvus sp. DL9XJH121]